MNYKIIILVLVAGVGLFYLIQTLKRTYHENITLNLNTLYQRLAYVENKTRDMETSVSKIVGTVGFHDLFNKVEGHGFSDILGENDNKYEPEVSDNEYQEETLDDDTHIPDDVINMLASSLDDVLHDSVIEDDPIIQEVESPDDTIQLVEQQIEELSSSNSDPVQSNLDPVQSNLDPVQSNLDPVQSNLDPVQLKNISKDIQRCVYIFKRGMKKNKSCNSPAHYGDYCKIHQQK